MSMTLRRGRPIVRRGFTLVELMIVVVLLSIVMGALMTVVIRQQRFYGSASEIIDTRSQIRQATELVPAELRQISTAGGLDTNDIYVMDSTSIQYRSTFGSSIACVLDAARTVITVPPENLDRRNGLTRWLRIPVAGDSLFILDDNGTIGGPGVWQRRQITAVAPVAGGCPAASRFTNANDVGKTAYAITVFPALPLTIPVGNPGNAIRFFEPVRYAMMTGADGLRYLGFCTGFGCNNLQPASGPYRANGIQFTYYDSLGAVTTNRRNVAQVRLRVRGETARAASLTEERTKPYQDSLDVRIAVRNRR